MRTGRKRILALLLSLLLFPGWSADVQAEEAEPTASEAQDAEPLIVEEELNRWMEDYLSQMSLNPDWQRFSVGFYYSGTGESWYYDADQWMYSASLYKVPVSMLMAEKEAAGEVTQDSWIATQYASGTLQYLESSALTWSNNDSGHALVEYLGGTYAGKCADQTVRFTELPDDYFAEDFFQMSYYSARYMTQVMATLLAGGEERFPHVIEYLLPAQPDGYLNLSLKGQYELAQKYGAYEEKNGNNNNHIAAIIYTPTPIVVTVMTRNVGDYQNRIAEVGAYLADYALKLDSRKEERKRAAEEAALQAAAEPSPEPTPEPAAETPVSPVMTPLPENEIRTEEAGRFPNPLLIAVAVLAAAALIIAAVLASAAGKRKKKRRKVKKAQREERADTGYRPRH